MFLDFARDFGGEDDFLRFFSKRGGERASGRWVIAILAILAILANLAIVAILASLAMLFGGVEVDAEGGVAGLGGFDVDGAAVVLFDDAFG